MINRAFVITAVLVAWLMGPPAALAQPHEGHHGSKGASTPRTVGVLIADHGEPPEYNAWTYESFREFFAHLIEMGMIPSWLAALERGTVLYDADCPACDEASDAPRLIDAWLRPHDGPAVFFPASESLPAHYIAPGGPGVDEPDIYEHVGLSAWDEWQRMGGRSPNYDEKLPKKRAAIERLRTRYGDQLAVRVGYMIDPRIGGARQGVREALTALVRRDRIDALVVVYHGVGFSDVMQTHHLRHLVAEHLRALGADLDVRYGKPLGTEGAYVDAVVAKVQDELSRVPSDAKVAIHLSGHGLPTDMCGEYDCGADAYHRHSRALFGRVRPALERAIERRGRTGLFHIYGDGGEGDDDPGAEVVGPMEGLDARAAGGYRYVIDVPYEFDSNSRDTLIILRRGYRRDPPDWNSSFESSFTYRGMRVKIANASGGTERKTDALVAVTERALAGWATPEPAAGSPDEQEQEHAHGAPAAAVGGEPRPHGTHAAAAPLAQRADHSPEHAVAAQAGLLAADHTHRHPSGRSAIPLFLGITGGAVLAVAASRARRSAAALALAGIGAQLIGLGWDAATHQRAGEHFHLLENGGHWLALGGLLLTGATAVHLLVARTGPDDTTPDHDAPERAHDRR